MRPWSSATIRNCAASPWRWAGASFPAPLYGKWFKTYSGAHENVQVDYQSVGSGGGVKSVVDRNELLCERRFRHQTDRSLGNRNADRGRAGNLSPRSSRSRRAMARSDGVASSHGNIAATLSVGT